MNLIERIIYGLQFEIERPVSYGWFHLLCLAISVILIIILTNERKEKHQRNVKIILLVYGLGALLLEVLKQIIWSFNYDSILNTITWDYQWYAFPFQLCTTPIFASLLIAFLKKEKIKDSLISYLVFITFLGSLATALYPETCFVRTLLVDIHTMYLHLGSLVVSFYLLITKEVKLEFKNLMNGYYIFLIFAFVAEALNIIMYNTGILNGETFNMFFISPYFPSSLPIYEIIWQKVPFIIYLIFYLITVYLGGLIIYLISKLISHLRRKNEKK